MKPNRVCRTCGATYSYCPNCSADSSKPRWMNMFDCDDCRIIFDTATKFNLNKITKEEAQKELDGINLDKNFTEQIQKDLEHIFYTEPTPIVEPDELEKKKLKSKNKKTKQEDYSISGSLISGENLIIEESEPESYLFINPN